MAKIDDYVYEKLGEVFDENEVETLVRVTYYLDQQLEAYKDTGDLPPAYKTLKRSLNNDVLFKSYAKRLAEDTKTAENNAKFHQYMEAIWREMLEATDEAFPDDAHQDWDVARLADHSLAAASSSMGFARAWAILSEVNRVQLVTFVRNVVTSRAFLNSLDEAVTLFNKVGGNVVMVGLAVVTLTIDVIKNIQRWWNGEISGKRCFKNILDSGVAVGAGVTGGMVGAAIGLPLGPIGAAVGGVVGGIAAGSAANVLIDRITQWLFNLPKEEALENAYRFFGLTQSASNHDINIKYRAKCLETHPDKGGSHDEFTFVQYNMAVIKAARGFL